MSSQGEAKKQRSLGTYEGKILLRIVIPIGYTYVHTEYGVHTYNAEAMLEPRFVPEPRTQAGAQDGDAPYSTE